MGNENQNETLPKNYHLIYEEALREKEFRFPNGNSHIVAACFVIYERRDYDREMLNGVKPLYHEYTRSKSNHNSSFAITVRRVGVRAIKMLIGHVFSKRQITISLLHPQTT